MRSGGSLEVSAVIAGLAPLGGRPRRVRLRGNLAERASVEVGFLVLSRSVGKPHKCALLRDLAASPSIMYCRKSAFQKSR